MGLQGGAQQLMEQQQQAVAEAAKAQAALAAATERMLALAPAAAAEGGNRDVFEDVEAELQGLRQQVQLLQNKAKRVSMEEKIAARQQSLEGQQQASAAASPNASSATGGDCLSPSEGAAMAAVAQVLFAS